jgi:hypothetical protein
VARVAVHTVSGSQKILVNKLLKKVIRLGNNLLIIIFIPLKMLLKGFTLGTLLNLNGKMYTAIRSKMKGIVS